MTERNGTAFSHATINALAITSHQIYAAAALTGLLANPDLLHDVDKTTSLAQKYAVRMTERDRGI